MAESSTTKLGEITKKFKAVNKDVINKLADYGEHIKSASSSITDEQAALVVDIITKESEVSEAEAEELRESAVKAVKEKEERQKREAKEKEQAEQAAREAEQAAKAAAKKAAREKAEAEQRAKRKAEEKAKKEKQKKHHNLAKKQSGVRVDLSNLDNSNTSEEYVIKSEKKSRTVDTRSSNVDLDKLEKSERLEKFADDMRVGRREKNKNKKTDKRQDKKGAKPASRRNERDQKKQQKQKPKPKVITEIYVPDAITVGDFAAKMGKGAAEVVKKLMLLGIMATVNQTIDFDTAELIADEFGIKVNKEIVLSKEDKLLMEAEEEDKPEDLVERPPVVVVMGHVDHGKTSLLDAIRHTSVISTEAGGITQHIGAYSVKLNDRTITFLDTPGHEAFTTMRARGAQVTDIAILVVAADDGIMPQTVEAINHAKAANVDIIVAINKIDKENANVERVKQSLMEYGLVPEEWGGDTVCVEISAKKKINIDGLLEMVLLVADMKELKANPNRMAKGTVIEARVDKGKGPVATVLVQNGTLRQGDTVICGTSVGHVRAMTNDKGRRVKEAGPSTPVEIQGLNEAPSGGDELIAVTDEKLARDVAEQRKQEIQEDKFNSVVKVSLDNLFSQIDEGNMKELDIIVKADVQGSVEAVKQSLEKLSNDEVRVRVIHGGVGAVNESDVMLANASNAIIVGFNVRPDAGAVALSQQNEVDIRLYRVIYQAIEEIEAAMKGMLDPEYKEVVLGYAEVRQTFRVPNVGVIAGSYVTQGKIMRNASVRVVRDGIIIHEGKISSLKRFKDDAKEVTERFECGLGIENFNDVKEGDTIECFEMQEIER